MNMEVIINFNLTFILYTTALVLCLVIVKFYWNRRWLYYHASKIPGLSPLPLIGSAHKFLIKQDDLYIKLWDIIKAQPRTFKIWLGPILFVFTSRPRDAEVVLNKCFYRGSLFRFGNQMLGDGLLTSHPTKWSTNRKIINPTFNLPTLHSFISEFNKHSKILVHKLQSNCGLESFDILLSVFCCAVDASCETLLDVDASLTSGQEDYIKTIFKGEKLFITRAMRFWLYNDFIWKYSTEGRKMKAASVILFDFIKKVIEIKKKQTNTNENSEKRKRFLNHLLNKSETNLDDETILEESQTMLVAGSQTQSITLSIILLILGMYPKIQEKLYKEIISVVGDNQDEITLDHINQMTYLDAVIKEALRLFPTVPLVVRDTAEDVKLDDYTIPAGTHIAIPIFFIHRLPEYWKNPETFNPDRFLSKEQENLPPCVYMPFSYGRRNCIGYKYAMLVMKVLLSTLLQYYKFESVDYKTIDEIELIYHVIIETKKGFKVKIHERRKL